MREIVIVLTDLYLSAESGHAPEATPGALPGLEFAARFGTATHPVSGWRDWLLAALGRADLAGMAPARIAAGVLGSAGGALTAPWIATPLHLQAGLSRVHLDHRGLLRLAAPERVALSAAFTRTFGASGLELVPLPCGEFLLDAPGVDRVPTAEPARCAGGEIGAALPRGGAAASLRRLSAEIEMWLHGERASTVAAQAVNALWLWGAAGRLAPAPRRGGLEEVLGVGADPFLDGLWHLGGSERRDLPQTLAAVLEEPRAVRAVLALRVSQGLQETMETSFVAELTRLDAGFVAPAVAALRRGGLENVTLIANDTVLALGRRTRRWFWRRPRPALAAFA